jgi:hypothetical protein
MKSHCINMWYFWWSLKRSRISLQNIFRTMPSRMSWPYPLFPLAFDSRWPQSKDSTVLKIDSLRDLGISNWNWEGSACFSCSSAPSGLYLYSDMICFRMGTCSPNRSYVGVRSTFSLDITKFQPNSNLYFPCEEIIESNTSRLVDTKETKRTD